MHVAFGRVRRKSRIVADYTDDADFRIFVYRRFWSGGRGLEVV